MKIHFQWKRFWCRLTGTIKITDNGFLLDPESNYARYYNQDVVSFDKIKSIPCLILLGEPGIGKTTAIISEIENIKKEFVEKSDEIINFNLNEYGDESRLINDVFESPEFEKWKNDDYKLHLFLDSYDECKIGIPNLTPLISKQFKNIKDYIYRLKLYISCRTGEWPETLTNLFFEIYGNENVGIYELVQLRKKDVELAAEKYELNQEKFLNAIYEKEIQPLASNPLTLKFLLDEFKENHRFPGTRYELFLSGCERLCTELNEDRIEAQKTGLLSSK